MESSCRTTRALEVRNQYYINRIENSIKLSKLTKCCQPVAKTHQTRVFPQQNGPYPEDPLEGFGLTGIQNPPLAALPRLK